MPTVLLALLLAGAASPAFSAEPNRWGARERGDRSEARSERSGDSRPQHSQRGSQSRKADSPAAARVSEPRRLEAVGPQRSIKIDETVRTRGSETRSVDSGRGKTKGDDGVRVPGGRSALGGSQRRSLEVRPPLTERAERRSTGDTVREVRMRDRKTDDRPASIEQRNVRLAPGIRESGGLVQQKRPLPKVLDQKERRVSRTPVFGTEPPAPRTATAIAARPERRWNSDWRHDRRFDWRDWRRKNRLRFHWGYYDPFGWDYFRYGIGWRLWPSYYRSSFWLHDPWYYRLPPAYGPYRWIRYHDDALLVNIYTGQVVDVIYNFFW